MQFSLYPLLCLLRLLPLVASNPIVRRDLATSDTQNDLTNGTPCKAMTIIFARGTVEAGNVGARIGPPLFAAVAKLIGEANLAVQGVKYPADIFGFLFGGDANGGKLMTTLIQQAFVQCPSTKLVVSGYSQGAQLVHNAVAALNATETSKINSVILFGDPKNGTAVGTVPTARTLVDCHKNDNICEHGIIVSDPHLNYSNDAPWAAEWVVKTSGLARLT